MGAVKEFYYKSEKKWKKMEERVLIDYLIDKEKKGKKMENEKEYCFNFRGKCLGVMAVSKESAYGYLYSEFDGVSKEELDDAYERGNQ